MMIKLTRTAALSGDTRIWVSTRHISGMWPEQNGTHLLIGEAGSMDVEEKPEEVLALINLHERRM